MEQPVAGPVPATASAYGLDEVLLRGTGDQFDKVELVPEASSTVLDAE